MKRDATARWGQQTTATRAVRASGAFALVSLHFRYVRIFLLSISLCEGLGEGEAGTSWERVSRRQQQLWQPGVELDTVWREKHALQRTRRTLRLGQSRAAK